LVRFCHVVISIFFMSDSSPRSRSRFMDFKKHKKHRRFKRERRDSSSRSREVKSARFFFRDRVRRGSSRTSAEFGVSGKLEEILSAIQTQGQKISLLEDERGHSTSTAALQPQEEPTALESRGIEPGETPCRPFFPRKLAKRGLNRRLLRGTKSTSFLVLSASPSNLEDRTVSFGAPDEAHPEESALVNQLFGTQDSSGDGFPWDQTIFDFIKATVRSGLQDGLRTQLLSKFEIKKELEALSPPKLNKLLLPVLKASSTVAKRDEYQMLAQTQIAATLNALGAGLSFLMKPKITSLLPADGRSVLSQMAEGIQFLADHQFRLSLARRAFIKPALNLLGKSTADLAPIDEWLFGSSFVEEVKDAQACERVARGLRSTPAVPRTIPQPAAKGPLSRKRPPLGNAKAPARQSNQPYRRAGDLNRSKSRSRRSASRSRLHRRETR